MSLKIISKTKIEQLADELIELLYSDTVAQDPFVERQIIVPNKNIEKWLKLRIAQNQGVCVGIEFPFFDNFLFKTLAHLADPTEAFTQVSEANLQIEIAKLIVSDDNDILSPLRDYVFGENGIIEIKQTQTARKLWQLAGKLANYIREYEFRRPDYINAFLSDNWIENTKAIIFDSNANKESLILAQAYLCRKLYQESFPLNGNVLSLRQVLYRATKATPSTNKKTLYIFGLSTFSPLHAKAIHLLAKYFDIQFYHINVCMEYWGDTESPWEKLKHSRLSEENGQLIDDNGAIVDNELLNAWGSAGRETMKLLVDLEESDSNTEYFNDEAFDFECASVLESLQKGIKTRTSDNIEKKSQDSSIQILACPDQKREIETIYNSILDILFDGQKKETDSQRKIYSPTPRTDISLSDFAILVPNMAKYRPIIETVFNSRGELPYGLLDSSAAAESHYLRGVIELLTIAQFRYTRSSMVSLLSNPCVMKRWNYSDDDLAIWIEYIDKLGIHHHYSQEGLAEDGLIAGDEFTWDYAISRLRLGLITVDEADTNSIPLYKTNNMYKERVEKLSALIETIYHATSPFKTEKLSISKWIEVLQAAAENILGNNDERMQSNISSALTMLADVFSSDTEFYSAFILEYLKDKLSNIGCNRGSFLTSGITIAALQPMRPIPFKYIYIVGLGEGEFPGNNQESTLDIRALKRMIGDTSFASRNLYLFLETVMSARERLVLSYVAKDTKKDIEKYPSSVIKQLERFLNKKILNGSFEEFNVQLQEYLLSKQCGERFKNLNQSYNNFIAIGNNIKSNSEYKDEILSAISSNEKLQNKISRSIYNLKPDFEQLIKNQELLDKNEDIFYWNANVLADFLINSRQAILKHRYRVATQTEEIDTSKDTAPKAISDENGFISYKIKNILFTEALNRIKKENTSPLSNKDAVNIIKTEYENLKRQSMTPVGVVGEYDIEVQIKSVLNSDYAESLDNPCQQNTIIDTLVKNLPTGGEWIKINIGQQSNEGNLADRIEKEINLSPFVYNYNLNGIETSVALNTTLNNVYEVEKSLFYISEKVANSKSLFLKNSLLSSLLSLIMYVATKEDSEENDYTICIRSIVEKTTDCPKSFYIQLTPKQASEYIHMLVSDIINPLSIVHKYEYHCLSDVVMKKILSNADKNAISENTNLEAKLKANGDSLIDSIINFKPEYNKEYKLNISNPPYCEGAIEELFSEIINFEENPLERYINILNTRYYYPIIFPAIRNEVAEQQG